MKVKIHQLEKKNYEHTNTPLKISDELVVPGPEQILEPEQVPEQEQGQELIPRKRKLNFDE